MFHKIYDILNKNIFLHNFMALQHTEVQTQESNETDAKLRAQILAEWISEKEITPELIASWAKINWNLDTLQIAAHASSTDKIRAIHAAAEATEKSGVLVWGDENQALIWNAGEDTMEWETKQGEGEQNPIELGKKLWEEIATKAPEEFLNIAHTAMDETKQQVTTAVKGAPDAISMKISEKINTSIQGMFTSIPWMWNLNFTSMIHNIFTAFFSGIWVGKFFSWLWLKKQSENTDSWEAHSAGEDSSSIEDPDTAWDDSWTPNTEENSPPNEANENHELTPNTREAMYISGSNLLLSLAGRTSYSEVDKGSIREGLKHKAFSEILTMNPDGDELLGDSITQNEAELRDEVLTKLKSRDIQTLLRVWLSSKSITNIIQPFGKINDKLARLFWNSQEEWVQRLQTILNLAMNWDENWWQALSFEEISILYIQSIPALRVPIIQGMWSIPGEVKNFFWNIDVSASEESFSLIPKSVLERFAKKFSSTTSNAFMSLGSVEELIHQLYGEETPSEEEKKAIEQLFDMQLYLSWKFAEEDKLGMNDDQKQLFLKNLDYAGVISLYTILNGQSNIETLNPVSFPVLLWTVSKIIGWNSDVNSSYQMNLYLWSYMRNALSSSSDLWLSKDEEEVLKIYGYKVMDSMLYAHLDGIAKTMGIPAGALDLDLTEMWLWMIVGWFAANKFGSSLIARWLDKKIISRTGWALRRFGLIGMFAWALTGWAGLILEENSSIAFATDLEWALNANDGEWDLKKLLDVLELHKNSIHEYPLPNGEKMVVSAYPWETPFVVMNKTIYNFNIWPAKIEDSIKSNWETFLEGRFDPSYIMWMISNLSGMKHTWIIDWVDYRVQKYQNGNIIFWEWSKTHSIPLEIIFQIWSEEPGQIWQDIIARITEWENTIPWIWSEGEPWYVINSIPPNHILFLKEIWKIPSE